MKSGFKRRLNAFTMMEAALSVAIVGVLMVSSTSTFGAIARARQSQVESRLAYLLGQQLMTEIMQGYFQSQALPVVFGPINGQTRAQFDYVDAYNGYTASPPVAQSGSVLLGYAGWSESVSVGYVSVSAPVAPVSTSSLKQITVTVTAPSGKAYNLTGLRSQFGAYELKPATQTNYITGVWVSLQAGAPAKSVYNAAHPLNITSSQ